MRKNVLINGTGVYLWFRWLLLSLSHNIIWQHLVTGIDYCICIMLNTSPLSHLLILVQTLLMTGSGRTGFTCCASGISSWLKITTFCCALTYYLRGSWIMQALVNIVQNWTLIDIVFYVVVGYFPLIGFS